MYAISCHEIVVYKLYKNNFFLKFLEGHVPYCHSAILQNAIDQNFSRTRMELYVFWKKYIFIYPLIILIYNVTEFISKYELVFFHWFHSFYLWKKIAKLNFSCKISEWLINLYFQSYSCILIENGWKRKWNFFTWLQNYFCHSSLVTTALSAWSSALIISL